MPGACAPPPGCDPTKPSTIKNCTGITACICSNLPGMITVTASDGSQFCVPEKTPPECPRIPIPNPVLNNPKCKSFPITPKRAIDPNVKAGTLGASAVGFIPNLTPLNYVIQFENLPTANAAAQIVEITDQLDPQKVDLDTFQLGPVAFGKYTLVPPPALQIFKGAIDLRPEQQLVVTVQAGLNKSTGLVTWTFASVDPLTLQLTEDPDAGLLPPNTTPPAGEGSVIFSVLPRAQLVTGATIANMASIVFDTNAALTTPTWTNTIDKDPPKTQVLPLLATQSSVAFPVQWSGTDLGSGIGTFRVFVSDNGGPFKSWLDHTSAVSATYTGQPDHSYGFFSVGQDRVGNAEPMKTTAEATTRVGGAPPACATDIGSSVQVTRSGYSYNFATARFQQTVTLKNTGNGTLPGPISLVLDSLSSNSTLFNATGRTACAAPAGSSFIDFAGSLGPGASGSLTMQFTNPTRAGITYTTRVLGGTGPR